MSFYEKQISENQQVPGSFHSFQCLPELYGDLEKLASLKPRLHQGNMLPGNMLRADEQHVARCRQHVAGHHVALV